MKIEWNENPLKTKVIFENEQERENFRRLIIADEASSTITYAKIALETDNAERALWQLRFFKEKEKENFQELFNEYMDALAGSHVGDCTCFAASCDKCRAEYLLGINTIEGLDQHAAHYVELAFRNDRNLDRAIEWLLYYEPDASDKMKKLYPDTWREWEKKWEKQADRAYTWLVNYKKEHFPNDNSSK